MTLFDSPASAAHWVLISAFGGWSDPLNVMCVTLTAAAVDAVLEEKHQRLVGSPLLLLCLCVLGVCVCVAMVGGWLGGCSWTVVYAWLCLKRGHVGLN